MICYLFKKKFGIPGTKKYILPRWDLTEPAYVIENLRLHMRLNY